MQFSMLSTQSVSVIGAPIDVNGNPSAAALSNAAYTSSDPTVFTVAPDPATPNGRLILGLKGLIAELELHTLHSYLVKILLRSKDFKRLRRDELCPLGRRLPARS